MSLLNTLPSNLFYLSLFILYYFNYYVINSLSKIIQLVKLINVEVLNDHKSIKPKFEYPINTTFESSHENEEGIT